MSSKSGALYHPASYQDMLPIVQPENCWVLKKEKGILCRFTLYVFIYFNTRNTCFQSNDYIEITQILEKNPSLNALGSSGFQKSIIVDRKKRSIWFKNIRRPYHSNDVSLWQHRRGLWLPDMPPPYAISYRPQLRIDISYYSHWQKYGHIIAMLPLVI